MSSLDKEERSDSHYARITITEGTSKALDLPQVDTTYLEDQWNEVSLTTTSQETVITVANRVGVIGLPSQNVLHITPKLRCNLLGMLKYTDRLDQELQVNQYEGATATGERFLELLAQLFQQELERVFRQGLAQKYRRKDATKRQIRGQLKLERQLQQQGPTPTKFECEYDELTYDISLNQHVLAALDVLVQLLPTSGVRSTLIQYRTQLGAYVSNRAPSGISTDSIEITRLQSHYRRIHLLSKAILGEQYLDNLSHPDQPFPSLVFDMPTVFEDTVVRTVQAAVDSTQYYVTENDLGTLAKSVAGAKEKRKLEPDFIIRSHTDEPSEQGSVVVVGDAKWKTTGKPSRNDFYQMATYQGQYGTPGVLVYPSTADTPSVTAVEREYEYTADTGIDGGRGSLYVVKIPVASKSSYNDYKKQLDNSLKCIIDEILMAETEHGSAFP